MQKNSVVGVKIAKNLELYYVNDGFPLDLKQIKSFLRSNIPKKYFSNVDMVYYYNLDNNKKAYYENNTIFITSTQCRSNKDFLKSLLHETGHSFYDTIENLDTFDRLKEEYTRKKNKVLDRLKSKYTEELSSSEEFKSYYNDFEKNDKFESFIEQNIGFDILYGFSNPYFPSPYCVLCLEEYFCVGLEIYYTENRDWIEQFCPVLNETIKTLEKVLNEEA